MNEKNIHADADPERAFHGWKILGLATFCQLISVGFTAYLLGVYIEPLSIAFDATPGQLGWGATIMSLTGALSGPLLGGWVDKGYIRRVLCIGALSLSSGFLFLSISSGLIQAAMACFLLALGASMVGIVPASALVVRWFNSYRGTALGIAAAGISVGGFLMPPIAAALMVEFGWRSSLQCLGVFVVITLLPAAWFITVNSPSDIGQYPDGKPSPAVASTSPSAGEDYNFLGLLRLRQFWTICITIGLISFANLLLITFLVPYAREQSLPPQSAAMVLSVYAGFGIVGKFSWGWLCDRFPVRRLISLQMLLFALAWLPMLLAKGAPFLLMTAAGSGLAVGGLVPVWASLIGVYFGPQAFGRVKGAMSFMLVVLLVLPGPLGGYLYDTYGSYELSFAFLWWSLPLGLVASLLIPSPVKVPKPPNPVLAS